MLATSTLIFVRAFFAAGYLCFICPQAMSLLDSIVKAVAAADDGELFPVSKVPIILNSDDIFPKLKPDSESTAAGPPIRRLSGWSISQTDSDIIESTSKFLKTLKKKLKKPQSLNRADFLQLLNSFLLTNSEKLGLELGYEPSNCADVDSVRSAIEKAGFLICQEVAVLVVHGCLVLELWEILEDLIFHRLVSHLYSSNLIEKLVDCNQARLLCLCVKHIDDLRPSVLLAVLSFFLSPSFDAYNSMLEVKKQWEKQALIAVEKATKKGIPQKASALAREASILLMVAHDDFSASESCLHHLFGNPNIDGLVFSSAISRLNGNEILALIRYLGKWLKKYERFPEAGPCLNAKSVLGLSACENVPSFDSVLAALGLTLDEHFSYLVLNSEFHDELRAMQEVVNALASEADASCALDGIVKHLQNRLNKCGRQ
ncbi:hypothetical protein HPP92_004435 [Vanilla planifolia]|uniref:Uncharacterized protein n=1 Tax=Vanilla planifolia TaxID=51239 RepID=A0A835RRH6_VANPL|nr:hypothetical protein HPP92_004435 [Vanilla planifolia]